MRQVVQGVLTPDGRVQLDEPIHLTGPRRAVIEILEEAPAQDSTKSTLETSPQSPSSGFPWSQHYRQMRFLGRGGMGETYQAEDVSTGAIVCIKQLSGIGDRRSLLQECRALARLSHPYVARLLNFDVLVDRPYLVMEYVDGVDVGSFINRKGPLPELEAVKLASRLFQALAYVYSQEIIHRDLKPNNLILVNAEEDPIPKIVDFGLAIVANRDQWDQDTGVGHIVGTPAYMAPEQVEGSKLGPACDVYALGQVIWELRMGQPAFSGSPLQVLSQKISRHDSLRIDTVELPGPRLSQVVADCTHVDPKNRPGANDVVSRLWEILRRNEPPIS